jgi:meiotically up-regulated gene 157 (Mug157) protein
MMFSRYLDSASEIMAAIGQDSTSKSMHKFAQSINSAIQKYGIVNDGTYGDIYAYEVDGFGGRKS